MENCENIGEPIWFHANEVYYGGNSPTKAHGGASSGPQDGLAYGVY